MSRRLGGRRKKHHMRQRRRWGIIGWSKPRLLDFWLKRLYAGPMAKNLRAESEINHLFDGPHPHATLRFTA